VIKRIKGLFSRGEEGDQNGLIRRSRTADVARRLERYAEAAGLAQGGAQDAAQELIRREIRERPKILVVGLGSSFSPRLVEYAVGFAKRMAYEIVAVNCAGLAQRTSQGLSAYQQDLFQEFKGRAARGVEFLAARATEHSVPFQHVVRPDSVEHCVRELEEEIGRVHFVLGEAEAIREIGVGNSIPVFSLVE